MPGDLGSVVRVDDMRFWIASVEISTVLGDSLANELRQHGVGLLVAQQ